MDWSSDVCSSYLFHVNGRFQPSPDPASCDQASEWVKATLRRQITDTAQGREIGQRQMQPDHRSFTAGTTEETAGVLFPFGKKRHAAGTRNSAAFDKRAYAF